jgi:hypothetical protein
MPEPSRNENRESEDADPVSNSRPRRGFAGILFLLAVTMTGLAFFAAFGSYSWYQCDYGMIPAYTWRILNGDVPYRDFIYVRPPLTLYLHSLWLLLPSGIDVSRAIYYLQFVAAAIVPALVASRLGLIRLDYRLTPLAIHFLVVSWHNFPIMPWYTVDGAMFG